MEYLQPITRGWMAKIRKAVEFKAVEFQNDADEALRFFDGPHDFMYGSAYAAKSGSFRLGDESSAPQPTFQMTVNKVAETVQLFGPVLYHRNPHRQVNPRSLPEFPVDSIGDPNDPAVQQFVQQVMMREQQRTSREQTMAKLLEYYLNWSSNELDLAGHARQMIDEALIKGMGIMWTETYQPHGSPIRMVGSFYDTVDNLVVDPDMESIRDAKWIARRRVLPKWEVERRFDLPKETLKGNLESSTNQALFETNPYRDYYRARGETNDLITYWEVYSRMGIGHLMSDQSHREEKGSVFDKFGPYIYLAVTDEHPWPLNVPEAVSKRASQDEVFHRLQWPTPFWADPTDPWPFTRLAFHDRPRKVWPMSHMKPAMGELKFLNWAFSFLADKVKNTSRDFVAILKSASEDIKSAVMGGRDLTLLEIEAGNKSIAEVVQFIQHPEFNGEIYTVISAVMGLFERRVGLNELMYGESSRQMRSATEAQVKGDQLQVRPDDMATRVEVSMTTAARKEAFACRWHLEPQDVAPTLGEDRAQLWGATVSTSDIYSVVHELEYRIEAGSIRKPNRQRDIENANNAVAVWGPVVQAYAQLTGDFQPLNFLATKWAKANDMEPQGILFNPPPPPQPDTSGAEMAQMEHEQMMQHKQEEHQLKLQQKMQEWQSKLGMDSGKHHQDIGQDQETHLQDLSQDQEKFLQELLQARREGDLKLTLERQFAQSAAANGNRKNAKSGNN